MLADAIPDRSITRHLGTEILNERLTTEDYGTALSGHEIDRFTDCIGITIGLGSPPGTNTIESAISSPTLGKCSEAVPRLQSYLDGDGLEQSYPYYRYWHGYSVVLRPLLSVVGTAGRTSRDARGPGCRTARAGEIARSPPRSSGPPGAAGAVRPHHRLHRVARQPAPRHRRTRRAGHELVRARGHHPVADVATRRGRVDRRRRHRGLRRHLDHPRRGLGTLRRNDRSRGIPGADSPRPGGARGRGRRRVDHRIHVDVGVEVGPRELRVRRRLGDRRHPLHHREPALRRQREHRRRSCRHDSRRTPRCGGDNPSPG